MVTLIIDHYDRLQEKLKERGVNVKFLGSLVAEYKAAPSSPATFTKIESTLRQMSYVNIFMIRGVTHAKQWSKLQGEKLRIFSRSIPLDAGLYEQGRKQTQ